MKCPRCGCEMAKDHLYCGSCGEEIRIVPDFEPEIEKEMDETLSALFLDISDEKASEDRKREKTEEGIGQGEEEGKENKEKRRIQWMVAGAAVLTVVWGLTAFFLYRAYSVSYQLSQAEKAAADERYVQAVSHLERAHVLKEEDADILFRMADYYYIQGKYDMALSTLQKVIESDDVYEEADLENAYDKSISVYRMAGNYQAINELLLSCEYASIVNAFQQYMAKRPEFSYVGGSYEEVLPLKLSANTSGKIYYTLDGSQPDEGSQVYTSPIFLETGTYTVTAYFVNDYGIQSDVVSHTYTIDLVEPAAPEVSVYSGEYDEPRMIAVWASEDCNIYYTTDGSQPTADSIAYTAAIPMPLGTSVYKFVAVSPEGISSDTTTRTYSLAVKTQITIDMALDHVKQALVDADILLDMDGAMRGMNGHNVYKYNSVVQIEDSGSYYVIHEYYEDATGIQTRTERIYGVSLQDGSPWRITYDGEGRVVLVKIE